METLAIDKTKAWTLDDYFMLGEMSTPCQLINGELIMSPAPSPRHQRVLRALFLIFNQQLPGETFFAPIDLVINRKNVFQPDLIYVSSRNKAVVTSRGIEGPVDIVVEIISPANSYTDRNQKKETYLKFGIGECWIVDPANESIEIYSGKGGSQVPILFLAGAGQVKSTVSRKLKFNLEDIF